MYQNRKDRSEKCEDMRPEILGRIHQVWNSIPQQLAKSNKKFVYGDIQKGARAKDYEEAIGRL